jgi:uncharacterized membrane protein
MIHGWLYVLTFVAALGCGLNAGVFFAFSSFVMKALGRIPSPEGIAAMQSINVEAPTAWFMAAFLGTAATCVVLVVASLFELGESYGVFLLVGGGLYLVGAIGLTFGYHIPRNDALATEDPNSEHASRHWAQYVSQWTAWNHVRTAASLAAAGALIGGLHVG